MADVEFTFSGDASSLKRALESIKSEIRNTKESVSSLSGQFVAMAVAVQGALTAVKAAFSVISNIPAQAARLEDLTTIFTTLMGDAQRAGALMRDLWHDAANGAVGLEQMAAAAKPLASVFGSNRSIREWTNRFADISAGSGMAADALSKLYARVLSLGKVDTRAIDGLARQGIPIYRELAAVIGVSTDQVQELAKKGVISADQYTAALRRMTDAGGEYYRQSSLLSNTSKGSWDTLLENINRVAAALGQPINEAITPVLQSMASYLEASLPQIQNFAHSMASAFSAVSDVLAPLVSGVLSLVSALGGSKTIVASVAAALLIFSGNAKTATASTITLRNQVTGLIGSLRGLSLSSIASAFKSALASMKSALMASLVSMKLAWSTAWATMATVVRGAMLAVKSAIISTGLGLILVGIGEALAALYRWFAGNSEAAEEAALSARNFTKSLMAMERQAAKVNTKEQFSAFMEGLDDQIEELRAAREQAYADEEWDKGDRITEQLNTLWQKKALYRETLPLQVEEARRAAEAAEQMKRQQQEAEALAQKLSEAKQQLDALVQKQKASEWERRLAGLDPEQEIRLRLRHEGFASLDKLKESISELETKPIEPGDIESYSRLISVYNKVIDLQSRAATQKRERAGAEQDYAGQLALLQAEVAGDAKRLALLRQQQRVVQLTEQFRKQGLSDAEAKARRIAELESQRGVKQAQSDYSQQINLLKAQISGDEKRLAALRKQQRIVQLTEQFRSQGLANAEKKAKRLAELEQKAADASASSSSGRSSAERISDSTASVGGGGRSVVIGGPMLSESKKHTQLLREMGASLKQKRTFQLSGNLKAVLGR